MFDAYKPSSRLRQFEAVRRCNSVELFAVQARNGIRFSLAAEKAGRKQGAHP